MKKEKTLGEHVVATIILLIILAILFAVGGYIVKPFLNWLSMILSILFRFAVNTALFCGFFWLVWIAEVIWKSRKVEK